MSSFPAPTPDQRVPATDVATPLDLPVGVSLTNPWARLGAYVLESILLFATLGIGWAIWAIVTSRSGQTPAKRLLKQRVVGTSTLRPVGFARMFWLRGLIAGIVAGFALLFTLGILAFMPLWDKRRQNIWDKVSSTVVVDDPLGAWQHTAD